METSLVQTFSGSQEKLRLTAISHRGYTEELRGQVSGARKGDTVPDLVTADLVFAYGFAFITREGRAAWRREPPHNKAEDSRKLTVQTYLFCYKYARTSIATPGSERQMVRRSREESLTDTLGLTEHRVLCILTLSVAKGSGNGPIASYGTDPGSYR